MKATELRIGNYILISILQRDGSFKNELFSVNATTIRDAEHYGNEWNAEPIPLTEEWLLKFGFELYEGEMIGETSMNDNWTLGLFKINAWGNGWLFYWDDKWDNRIQYVHQLQNLYFALTNEELTIKQDND